MKNRPTIREAVPADHDEIYRLIKTAFETARVKDGDEQDFAVGLRSGESYVPGLELVAEQGGVITGHVMLTRTLVESPDGERHEVLLVAPLSVMLEHRGRGVGSLLMTEGLHIAREKGYRAALLAGDPDYYGKLGFTRASAFGIVSDSGIPEQFVLARELYPGSLKGITGKAAVI